MGRAEKEGDAEVYIQVICGHMIRLCISNTAGGLIDQLR